MKKITKAMWLLGLVSFLGACERVKDKEEIASLPETSKEDTLVFTPDSVEIDTAYYEGNGAYAEESYGGYAQEGGPTSDQREFATNDGSAPAGNGTVGASGTGSTERTATSGAPAATKKYVRPSKQQLQRSLAADARRSGRMSLSELRSYWLKRQHYYRRASREVKYVAGPTKIKISPEETKIETARGKVKIEGQDIKVKPD